MTNNNNKLAGAIVMALVLISTAGHANDSKATEASASLKLFNNSNVFQTQDDLAQSDSGYIFSPSFSLNGRQGGQFFSASYSGDFNRFQSLSSANFDKHLLTLLTNLEHSQRLSSDIKLTYLSGIEQPINSDATTTLNESFTEVKEKQFAAALKYGKFISTGQLVLGFERIDKSYSKNEQSYRSHVTDKLTGQFYYRIAAKTRFFIELAQADLSYDNPIRNSTLNLAYLGMEWQATANTSGELKLGYLSQDFENELLADVDAFSYVADLNWQPSDLTEITLTSSRQTKESAQNAQGAFVESALQLVAKRKLTEMLSLQIGVASKVFDFNSTIPEQTMARANLGLDYAYSDRLTFTLGVAAQNKRSDEVELEFDSNQLSIGIRGQL